MAIQNLPAGDGQSIVLLDADVWELLRTIVGPLANISGNEDILISRSPTGIAFSLKKRTGLEFAYLKQTGGDGGTDTTPASWTYDLCADYALTIKLYSTVRLASSTKRLPVPYLKAPDASECWYRIAPDPDDGNKPKAMIVICAEIPDVNSCAAVTTAMDGGTA